MPQPNELTATEAARQIRQGQLSPVALAEACLARIAALEPKLKAWVYLDREAVLTEARQKEAEVKAGGQLGLLHGIPIGLKDIYFTKGIPTTACSKLWADFAPDYDATTVTRLKEAGAVMLGKTVTTEFACLDPSPTVNPWNPAHTPGGSSSGSAAAVASRMCPAALGSQTVGSVLRPAAYNGIVGLKPTYGLVSRYGVAPVSWSLDTMGWLVPSVEDAALLLQVLAGPDASDPLTRRVQPADYLAPLRNPQPPRIGLLRGLFHDHADAETRQHINEVAERLARAGASVEELPLPASLNTAFDDQRLIMAVEAAAFHEPMYRQRAQDYQPKLRAMLAQGLEINGMAYSRALERRLQFTADMVELAGKADVLLTPATPAPAPKGMETTGNPLFQGPWTSCGLPAIALPSGVAASGLPLGIQLAAAPFAEARLLAAARWCEAALNFQERPPV